MTIVGDLERELMTTRAELDAARGNFAACFELLRDIRVAMGDTPEPELPDAARRLRADSDRWHAIATPEVHDFVQAVEREALHQRQRWSTEHDGGKQPEDWLWLVAYLATKAVMSHRYSDREKYLHHIVTTAAACCNWHANASGVHRAMRAGAVPLEAEKMVAEPGSEA
jgi:hypothetical protein